MPPKTADKGKAKGAASGKSAGDAKGIFDNFCYV